MNAPDVQQMILEELREIKTEVRLIPKLQVMVDDAGGKIGRLDTAMRENASSAQMQIEAHGRHIDNLRLEIHRSMGIMEVLSGEVRDLTARVRDLEKQTQASFTQQQVLARQVREVDGRDHGPALDAHLDDYREIRTQVSALAVVVDKLAKQLGYVVEYMPFIRAWKYFVYTLGAAAVLMIVRVVLQLVLERGVVP